MNREFSINSFLFGALGMALIICALLVGIDYYQRPTDFNTLSHASAETAAVDVVLADGAQGTVRITVSISNSNASPEAIQTYLKRCVRWAISQRSASDLMKPGNPARSLFRQDLFKAMWEDRTRVLGYEANFVTLQTFLSINEGKVLETEL